MKDLRNEAVELAANLPEKYLPSIIGLMKSFGEISDEQPVTKKKLDLTQYINKGKKMFKDADEVEEYIKESRRERF